MRYRIVHGTSTNRLELMVNMLLARNEGWEPLGGPVWNGAYWWQALTNHNEFSVEKDD